VCTPEAEEFLLLEGGGGAGVVSVFSFIVD